MDSIREIITAIVADHSGLTPKDITDDFIIPPSLISSGLTKTVFLKAFSQLVGVDCLVINSHKFLSL